MVGLRVVAWEGSDGAAPEVAGILSCNTDGVLAARSSVLSWSMDSEARLSFLVIFDPRAAGDESDDLPSITSDRGIPISSLIAFSLALFLSLPSEAAAATCAAVTGENEGVPNCFSSDSRFSSSVKMSEGGVIEGSLDCLWERLELSRTSAEEDLSEIKAVSSSCSSSDELPKGLFSKGEVSSLGSKRAGAVRAVCFLLGERKAS